MEAETQHIEHAAYAPGIAMDAEDEAEILGLLSPEESWTMFDDMAQEYFQVNGKEFIAKLDAGEYDEIYDDPDYPELMNLALFADVFR